MSTKPRLDRFYSYYAHVVVFFHRKCAYVHYALTDTITGKRDTKSLLKILYSPEEYQRSVSQSVNSSSSLSLYDALNVAGGPLIRRLTSAQYFSGIPASRSS